MRPNIYIRYVTPQAGSDAPSMALALAKAAPIAPVSNLREALIDFEKVLTVEEKNEFRAQETPDATAAIKLTISIDKNPNKRRCNASRLITFLESVQQFSTTLSSTVDTLVSAHPEIAALVWGGVKLSLLVLPTV